ncbi:MAG TPA: dynamin family protein [Streptosporangiaceae bacterium]|nr:dynamin family protein [Streptosporangiaceae bacterium]
MSGQQAPSGAARHALETLDLAIQGTRAYEREDLAERLASARRLLTDSTVMVHVVGEFKQGKSSLVNALLMAPICPVDDDIATAVSTEVRYAEKVCASASFESLEGSDGAGWTETISPSEIASYVSEAGNPGNTRRLRSVTVGIDRPLLASGLALVDTPGVGGLGSIQNAAALSTLPQSHAVLFVSDASQELTAAELRFLGTVQDLCPTVVMILSKTDLYPHWEQVLRLDRAHLERRRIAMEVLPLSSEVRGRAARTSDQEMNNESGFPPLVRRLGEVVTGAERLALDAVAAHVLSAVDQLEVVARAHRAALIDPEALDALIGELTAAKQRADALRERSAKWQQLLQDGFSDIASDIDFDLRDRSRTVLHEAEETISEGDPAKNWEEFEAWLRQRLAAEALENYAIFVRRAKEVAATVSEHFALAEADVIRVHEVAAPVELIDQFAVDSNFVGLKNKGAGLATFQKAYSGMLMFTMLTHLAGLTLFPMFLPVIGLAPAMLMGRAGLMDDRRRKLEQRRAEAKVTVRRFVDDFNLQVGKDSRDAVRHVQRELRSACADRVTELQRSASEALAAAQTSVASTESASKQRERIDSDLATLASLRARMDDLAAHRRRTEIPPTPAQGVQS